MKLHDLKPAPGSRKERTRVGRGIAAGKGKTAGRGTKGQKSRAGSGIPAWFEGGQTPIHMRVPKLRGFKRRGRIEYQVVNVGRIAQYAAAGRFGPEPEAKSDRRGAKDAPPTTVNATLLASAGLIGTERRPVKVLGNGDVETKLFIVADAFTASARRKIEDAGGYVQLLVEPPEKTAEAIAEPAAEEAAAEVPPDKTAETIAEPTTEVAAADAPADKTANGEAKPAARRTRRSKVEPPADGEASPAESSADAPPAPKRSRRASQD